MFLMNLPETHSSCSLAARTTQPPLINIGCGEDQTILDLARARAVKSSADRAGFRLRYYKARRYTPQIPAIDRMRSSDGNRASVLRDGIAQRVRRLPAPDDLDSTFPFSTKS